MSSALLKTKLREAHRIGEFSPDGHEQEWCSADVMRRIKRPSLAKPAQVESVDASSLARLASMASHRPKGLWTPGYFGCHGQTPGGARVAYLSKMYARPRQGLPKHDLDTPWSLAPAVAGGAQ